MIASLSLPLAAAVGRDMNETLLTLLYLVASVLFIFGVKRLAGVRTAAQGNRIAAAGMGLAILTTLVAHGAFVLWIPAGLIVGAAIGAYLAKKVEMTGMPELVGIFNGLGGIASTLVALSFVFSFTLNSDFSEMLEGQDKALSTIEAMDDSEFKTTALEGFEEFDVASTMGWMTAISIALSVLIGAITLSGSLVAFGKLSGKINGNPILIPARHAINIGLLAAALLFTLWFACAGGAMSINTALLLLTLVALTLGVFAVIPIGGADMPVVISLLNSYSGLAAAMTGFVLHMPLLIITGSLVGASGLILTKIMCKAMNRSLANVLFGGFGGEDTSGGGKAASGYTNVKSCGAEETAMVLEAAQSVIFVPGYGLAVAQAQHAVKELGDLLEARGADVKYAIHPVAGRMPGHMNVLLAEANVPYEQLIEMDDINPQFKNTDVAIVIGANDVVNPVARNDKSSPIYGMPILDVDQARSCFVIKRSLSPGFAGIDNPLFEADNNMMIFGDAKQVLEDVVKELKNN